MKINIESAIENANVLELNEIIQVATIAKNIEEIQWALKKSVFSTIKIGFVGHHVWVKEINPMTGKLSENRILFIN